MLKQRVEVVLWWSDGERKYYHNNAEANDAKENKNVSKSRGDSTLTAFLPHLFAI